jgi:hypothetical protein
VTGWVVCCLTGQLFSRLFVLLLNWLSRPVLLRTVSLNVSILIVISLLRLRQLKWTRFENISKEFAAVSISTTEMLKKHPNLCKQYWKHHRNMWSVYYILLWHCFILLIKLSEIILTNRAFWEFLYSLSCLLPESYSSLYFFNPLNPELNPICYFLALLAHHFLHVSRIRDKSLTLRLLMPYIWITYSWCF